MMLWGCVSLVQYGAAEWEPSSSVNIQLQFHVRAGAEHLPIKKKKAKLVLVKKILATPL